MSRKSRDALVLAVSYFAAAWLGRNVKAEILVEHLSQMSRQTCETPDFHCYALAAGLKMAFMRHGKRCRVIDERKSPQLELSLDRASLDEIPNARYTCKNAQGPVPIGRSPPLP